MRQLTEGVWSVSKHFSLDFTHFSNFCSVHKDRSIQKSELAFSLFQNIECWLKNDAMSKRSGGILLAPKQGKKNLAKFLGIDMSALSDYDGVAGVAGSTTQGM